MSFESPRVFSDGSEQKYHQLNQHPLAKVDTVGLPEERDLKDDRRFNQSQHMTQWKGREQK